MRTIEMGDTIIFNQTIHRRVVAIRTYPNIPALLANEPLQRILPNKTTFEIERLFVRIWGAGIYRKKCLVFELAKLDGS